VARALPRPGPWMDALRKLMAFPMLITVVWLVWVMGHQSGIDGAGALLTLLVALSALIWSLTLSGRLRRVVASLMLLIGVWSVWAVGPYMTAPAPSASDQRTAEGWQDWAPGRVEALLATDRPVFVDFTAAWCVTCQYNKQTTLADPDVLADLRTRQVALLRADWTRRDPAITAALSRLGRNGVPVYVLYKNGQPPQILSEVLSVQEVRAALARL
ncbi:MAG: thioredoxin family protein, partial [Hylemonella sp.]|nr:thioredoxin family protein [Hylemonella sp.]